MVPIAEFAKHCAPPQGATHWIISSQTCNVQHESLDQVPLVEVIAARELSSTEFNSDLARGIRPRTLHTCGSSEVGQIFLALEIHQRFWLPRSMLAQCRPSQFAIEDLSGDFSGRFKEVFASWLGRSYTRLELPNDFNDALDYSGIKGKIFSKLRRHDGIIQGIYLLIANEVVREEEDDLDDMPLTPSEIAKSAGPYNLEITVVLHDGCSADEVALVKSILEEIKDKRLPSSKLPETMRIEGESKCSMSQVAASKGIMVGALDVVSVKAWTVYDLIRTVRFTDYDYLSNVLETDDA